jgi:hypothetical protein
MQHRSCPSVVKKSPSPTYVETKGSVSCSQGSLYWTRWIHATPAHPIYLRSTLILSFHLHIYSKWSLAFKINGYNFVRVSFSPSHARYMSPGSHSLRFYHRNILWREETMKLLISQFSPGSCDIRVYMRVPWSKVMNQPNESFCQSLVTYNSNGFNKLLR